MTLVLLFVLAHCAAALLILRTLDRLHGRL